MNTETKTEKLMPFTIATKKWDTSGINLTKPVHVLCIKNKSNIKRLQHRFHLPRSFYNDPATHCRAGLRRFSRVSPDKSTCLTLAAKFQWALKIRPLLCWAFIQIKRGRGRVVLRNILREFHMETLNVHYKGFPINKITVRDVEPSPCLKQRALVCVFVCTF